MPTEVLTKQFIVDVRGQPIGVILPIEEYEALTQRSDAKRESQVSIVSPLLGALKSEHGEVATTKVMDETLRELWSVWDSATALSSNIPLVTRDRKIQASQIQTVW